MRKFVLFSLLGIFASAGADDALPLFEGDASAGQQKMSTCVACHQADGNSQLGQWPKLAGQHPKYLYRQLMLFKSQGRENAVMLGMVAGLSEEDMRDLAAYYATQELQPGTAKEENLALGEEVYRAGVAQRGVPACAGCHGPNGRGNPLAGYPSLRSQHAQYLGSTLRAFRDGTVWGKGDNANAVMAGVAANLSDEEIDAVSNYIQGLY